MKEIKETIENPEMELQKIYAFIRELETLSADEVAENIITGKYSWGQTGLAIRRLGSGKDRVSIEKLKKLDKRIPYMFIWNQNPTPITHEMVDKGYEFTFDELLSINHIKCKADFTPAHRMTFHGYKFTLNELLQLGNPPDYMGATIAHSMAQKGHQFSEREINILGNPKFHNGHTINDFYRIGLGFKEINKKGNKRKYVEEIFLLFKDDGSPYFINTETQKEENTLCISWGVEVIPDGYYYCTEIDIVLMKKKDKWTSVLRVITDKNEYLTLYHKMKVLEISKNINQSIKSKSIYKIPEFLPYFEPYDFSHFVTVMNNRR